MKLEKLGYTEIEQLVKLNTELHNFNLGRVIAEHKERYVVGTENGEVEAEITGNLRFTALSREDFPAVGDWVALTIFDSFAVINQVIPRFSLLKRKALGKGGEAQIIAANVHTALLMQSVLEDFNINRLERYLAICNTANVLPIVILTKIDLLQDEELESIKKRVKARIGNIPVVAISNENNAGYEELDEVFQIGKTYCMLGSSGVGKSTLMNNLMGTDLMKTGHISHSTNKGRHVTSHRELTILQNGSILIDNPGMREVGLADDNEGVDLTFDAIKELSSNCKFRDCTHTSEKGCAVIEAVELGEIDNAYYENYLKLERESAHYSMTVHEKRRKGKEFGKMVKVIKKNKRK